jgi:PadR family transcriptional regulator PadR
VNIQYKKGVLELCVMALLYKEAPYGYDISEYISKHIDISDGTIYPILRKLKSDGIVKTYLSEQSGGPPRKYYSITELGKEEFIKAKSEWFEFISKVNEMLKEEKNE